MIVPCLHAVYDATARYSSPYRTAYSLRLSQGPGDLSVQVDNCTTADDAADSATDGTGGKGREERVYRTRHGLVHH